MLGSMIKVVIYVMVISSETIDGNKDKFDNAYYMLATTSHISPKDAIKPIPEDEFDYFEA